MEKMTPKYSVLTLKAAADSTPLYDISGVIGTFETRPEFHAM